MNIIFHVLKDEYRRDIIDPTSSSGNYPNVDSSFVRFYLSYVIYFDFTCLFIHTNHFFGLIG